MANKFVQQRVGNDCNIAATAAVIGQSYEAVAEAFGIPVDAEGRPNTNNLGPGIRLEDTIFPLFELGWLATPLIAREHPNYREQNDQKLATNNDIKTAITGRKAVLGYQDKEIGNHTLAWDGEKARDCSNGEFVDLDDILINTALILSPR